MDVFKPLVQAFGGEQAAARERNERRNRFKNAWGCPRSVQKTGQGAHVAGLWFQNFNGLVLWKPPGTNKTR